MVRDTFDPKLASLKQSSNRSDTPQEQPKMKSTKTNKTIVALSPSSFSDLSSSPHHINEASIMVSHQPTSEFQIDFGLFASSDLNNVTHNLHPDIFDTQTEQ